jgi:glycosyltransferase 2 family protein
MKKIGYKYILYLSIVFLLVGLYRTDILNVPQVLSPGLLAASLVLLFGGFIASALAHGRLLARVQMAIPVHQALAMFGLTIFSNYIPGKVMIVFSKIAYLGEKNSFAPAALVVAFVRAQIIALWCSLLLGIIGLGLNDALHLLSAVGLLLVSAFTVALFSGRAHRGALRLINRLFSKSLDFPPLSMDATLALIPWFAAIWVLWGAGFYLFCQSLTPYHLPVSTAFCFPLACAFGILALFSPGGIGIREGIIVVYFTLMQIDLDHAVTLSAASRLWFLAGEIFIFGLGYLAHRRAP